MFVYQPTFNTLELKKDKDTDYVIGWKSKGLFESKLLLLHGVVFSPELVSGTWVNTLLKML